MRPPSALLYDLPAHPAGNAERRAGGGGPRGSSASWGGLACSLPTPPRGRSGGVPRSQGPVRRQEALLCVPLSKCDRGRAWRLSSGGGEGPGKEIEKGPSWEMNLTSNWKKYKLISAG